MTTTLNASRGEAPGPIGGFLARLVKLGGEAPGWTWIEPSPTRDPLPDFPGLWPGWSPESATGVAIDEARVCWPGAVLHLCRNGQGFQWVLLTEEGAVVPNTGLAALEEVAWKSVSREVAGALLAGPNQRARLGAPDIPGHTKVSMVVYRRDGQIVGWGLES